MVLVASGKNGLNSNSITLLKQTPAFLLYTANESLPTTIHCSGWPGYVMLATTKETANEY